MKYVYIAYQYLFFFPVYAFFTVITAVITLLFSRYKYSMWLHRVQMFWARCFCYLLFVSVTTEGGDEIERDKSYVFVSNHQSLADVFLIYGWLPVIFKWLIKKEIHRIPFIGIGCDAAGHIFVDRQSRNSSVNSVRRLEHILRDGCSTVIFPEGHRTLDGQLQPFRRGAFQMAVDMHVPIVPLALSGCYNVAHPGKRYFTRHNLKIHIGSPIDVSDALRNDTQKLQEHIYHYIENHIESLH